MDGVYLRLRGYADYVLYLVSLALLAFIVYRRDLAIVYNEALHNPDLSHVLAVPLLSLVLFYLKRDLAGAALLLERTQVKTRVEGYRDMVVGLCLCLAALIFYWWGSHTFHPLEYHLLSLPVFLAGVTLVLLNYGAVRALAQPLCFLFFLVPAPARLVYGLGGALSIYNTYAAYLALRLLRVPVLLSDIYGLPAVILAGPAGASTFSVDVSCSGVYSLMAFVFFSVFLAFISPSPVVKKLAVLLVGLATFNVLSVARLVTIISVAHVAGVDLAMRVFHLVAGFALIFAGMTITVAASEKLLKVRVLPEDARPSRCPACGDGAPLFCPRCGAPAGSRGLHMGRELAAKTLLLGLLVAVAVASVNAPTFTVAEGPMDLSPGTAWEEDAGVLPMVPGYRLKWLYRDVGYEERAGQDAALVYVYHPDSITVPRSNIQVSIGVADSVSLLHNWEVCLVTMQVAQGRNPLVEVLDQRDVVLLEDAPLVARFLVFRDEHEFTHVVLYWFEKANFKTGVTVQQKYVRFSLITVKHGHPDIEAVQEELYAVGRLVAEHWMPLQRESFISLGVPAQQALLVLLSASMVLTTAASRADRERARGENRKVFMAFATDREKAVLRALAKTGEGELRGVAAVREAVYREAGIELDPLELAETLARFEMYGFLERGIAGEGNTPITTWRIHRGNG